MDFNQQARTTLWLDPFEFHVKFKINLIPVKWPVVHVVDIWLSFTNNIACFSQTTPTKTEQRTLKKHSSTPSTLKLVGNANPNANTTSFCEAVELESFVALSQNLEPSSILFFFFFFRLLQPVPRWPPSLLLRASPYFQGTLSLSLTYSQSKCRLLLFVLYTGRHSSRTRRWVLAHDQSFKIAHKR